MNASLLIKLENKENDLRKEIDSIQQEIQILNHLLRSRSQEREQIKRHLSEQMQLHTAHFP